jgi:hypothetical protein
MMEGCRRAQENASPFHAIHNLFGGTSHPSTSIRERPFTVTDKQSYPFCMPVYYETALKPCTTGGALNFFEDVKPVSNMVCVFFFWQTYINK